MIMSTPLKPTERLSLSTDDIDYLLSLTDSELESWLTGFQQTEQSLILQAMLSRQQELQNSGVNLARERGSERQEFRHQVRSKPELADELGISLPTLAKYIRLGMPAAVTPYDVAACQQWVHEYRGQAIGVSTAKTDDSLLSARLSNLATRTRRDEITSEIESIELEKKRGSILLAEDVLELFRRVAATSMTILDGLEDAIDRELPEKCPSEEAWRELKERALRTSRQIARDVASQIRMLVEKDAE